MATLYIPGNFDLQEHTKQHPVDHIYRYHPDKLYYLLHVINETAYRNPDNITEEGFVRLHSSLLKRAFAEYDQHMRYLITTVVVQSDRRYIPGVKATGYRLSEKYRHEDLIPISVQNTGLKKKLQQLEAINPDVKEQYPHLVKWFETQKLEINYEAALAFNRKLFREKQQRKMDADNTIFRYIGQGGNREEYNAFLAAFDIVSKPLAPETLGIRRIAERHYIMSVDESVGRLHTNLTNLKSELRNALSYDDQELVSLDVSNCQPLLTLALLEPWFWATSGTSANKDLSTDSIKENHPPLLSFSTLLTTLPSHHHLTSLSPLNMFPLLKGIEEKEDVILYRRLCMEGRLYSYLKKEMQKAGLQVPEDAKQLKAVIFTVLFTSNRFAGQEEAGPKRFFKCKFPNVMRVFEAIKKGKGNKNRLSVLLQRMESYLFLEAITKRIDSDCPEVVQFTIHDSIITLSQHEMYVRSVIAEEFMRMLGLEVNVKNDRLTLMHLPLEESTLSDKEKKVLNDNKQQSRRKGRGKGKIRTGIKDQT